MSGRFSYQWDDREKAWVVITWNGMHDAVFMCEQHAELWMKLRNGQAYVVDREPPTILGESHKATTSE